MNRLLQALLVSALLAFNGACAEESAPEATQQDQGKVIEEGKDFSRVLPAQPTSTAPGEIEVLEFFWYGCPHCYQAERHVADWARDLPENITFRRIPATLNRGWQIMAKAYYTAEQLGVLETMHPALFAAFHENGTMLANDDQIAAYFKVKAGVDEATFHETFNSMRVSSLVQRADLLSRRYRVTGVPAMTVNGKFITDPEKAGGYDKMVDTVGMLARWELKAHAE